MENFEVLKCENVQIFPADLILGLDSTDCFSSAIQIVVTLVIIFVISVGDIFRFREIQMMKTSITIIDA